MWHVWGKGNMRRGHWWRSPREGAHLEDPSIDGRIILKWTFGKWDRSTDWVYPAWDRYRWWVFVNAVMNLLVS
jgi:hypothetical protein